MRPSLTRRGWGTLAVVVALTLLAARFGARSLNAVVMPLVLAVGAAYLVAWRADAPVPTRLTPEDSFVGTTRPVELRFETDAPATGRVTDAVGPGLTAAGNDVETTVGARPVEYTVSLDERGAHDLGPATVTVRDVLGLAERGFEFDLVDEVVAYPRAYDLAGATRSELALLAGAALDREREEFDRLREYEPGDSLRDVHWKTSAKRTDDELVVKEFVAEEEVSEVLLSVRGEPGTGDAMAEAAASLALHLLGIGVGVGVVAPDGSVEPGRGPDHRAELLELLALTGPGAPAESPRPADVRVEARRDEVVVAIGEYETTFSELAGLDPAAGVDERGAGRDPTGRVERAGSGEGRRGRDGDPVAPREVAP